MKKLLLILSVSLFGLAEAQTITSSDHSYATDSPDIMMGSFNWFYQVDNNTYYFKRLGGMDSTRLWFSALSYLDIYNTGNALVGVNDTGRLFRYRIQDLPFKPSSYTYTETDPLFETKFSGKSTTNLSEGSNLYYTSARFNTAFSSKSTSDLTEGTNLYHTTARARASISAGNGLSYNSSTGVISQAKRRETYSGTTNSSGVYTVTFATSYSTTPNIQANIIGGSDIQMIRITSISTTGFTVLVREITSLVGLLPTYNNVNGAIVDILISEK